MAQRYTDQIIKQADLALEALTDEFLADEASQEEPLPESGILDIEFGSLEIPRSRLPRLQSGTVLELNEPAEPTVTLCYAGRPVAEGILLIQDGMIAVQITRKNTGPDR